MTDLDECVCAKCGRDYFLGEGCEPSKYCNACVHDVVVELEAQLSTAKKRIRELEREVELYSKGYAARGQILVAYRTGRQPIGKALADAADVQKKLGLISKADTNSEGRAESGAPCETCHGSGSAPLVPMSTCATCFGSGKAPPK